MTALLLALGLGFVSGLRTFTPVAAVIRRPSGSSWRSLPSASTSWTCCRILLRAAALGLSARVVSGAFVGWMIATMHDGSGMLGAIVGIAGAVIGGSRSAARLAAIARIGPTLRSWKTSSQRIATFIVTR